MQPQDFSEGKRSDDRYTTARYESHSQTVWSVPTKFRLFRSILQNEDKFSIRASQISLHLREWSYVYAYISEACYWISCWEFEGNNNKKKIWYKFLSRALVQLIGQASVALMNSLCWNNATKLNL